MFVASLKISIIEMPPHVLRYDYRAQNLKIAESSLVEEEMAAQILLLLFEIRPSVYWTLT